MIFFPAKPPVCPSRQQSYTNSLRSNPCSSLARQSCPSVSRCNSDTMRRRGLPGSSTMDRSSRTIRSCSSR